MGVGKFLNFCFYAHLVFGLSANLLANPSDSAAPKALNSINVAKIHPEKHLLFTSICRMYFAAIKNSPKNTDIRNRFVEFLLDFRQEKRAMEEMIGIARLTPSDENLRLRIDELKSRVESLNSP